MKTISTCLNASKSGPDIWTNISHTSIQIMLLFQSLLTIAIRAHWNMWLICHRYRKQKYRQANWALNVVNLSAQRSKIVKWYDMMKQSIEWCNAYGTFNNSWQLFFFRCLHCFGILESKHENVQNIAEPYWDYVS